MSIWVSVSAVEKFPLVLKQFKKTSEFRKAGAAEINATSTWARRAPGVGKGSAKSAANLQCDVQNIPGVAVLRRSGVKA